MFRVTLRTASNETPPVPYCRTIRVDEVVPGNGGDGQAQAFLFCVGGTERAFQGTNLAVDGGDFVSLGNAFTDASRSIAITAPSDLSAAGFVPCVNPCGH